MSEMADFKDSTALMDDGPALKKRLDIDGYLFIRNLLPAEAVINVRQRLLQKAAQGEWLDRSKPIQSGVANLGAACKDPEEQYMKVFRTLWRDEELHRLRTHPNVLSFFKNLFNETPVAHPMFVQRNIFPQHNEFDFTTGAHQDKVHIGGATNYAMWVPIGDCPLEKGPLAVATKSHIKGVLQTKVGAGAGGMDISEQIPGSWVTGSFRSGDVLIFGDTTVHKALPNRSDEIRQSFDARYQPSSQPLAEPNLLPYSGTGNWEEIYATWESTDSQYYWRSLNLKIVPFDKSYYEKRDQMAFDMAERGEMAARDALLRIIQRDSNQTKRTKAQKLVKILDGAQAAD